MSFDELDILQVRLDMTHEASLERAVPNLLKILKGAEIKDDNFYKNFIPMSPQMRDYIVHIIERLQNEKEDT